MNLSQGNSSSKALLSFCETLASSALQQGMKEGIVQVMDSTYLKVKLPKPPRRHNILPSPTLDVFESNSMNVRMSVTDEGQENKIPVQNEGLSTPLNCSHTGKPRKSGCKIDFVALDVQALEQMTMSCSSETFPCTEDKNLVLTASPSPRTGSDMVRSATDFDIKCKRGTSSHRRPGYDPHSIYDITEYPQEASSEPLISTLRCISASDHLASSVSASSAPQVPPEMASYLEEPLLLVGHKLEWEGHVNARKISAARKRKKNQQMTPREQRKLTRVVIGYTLAFFLLVIVTFYIVYFV